jgi:hypothetical protein
MNVSHMNISIILAISALVIAALSPLALMFFQRRARSVDERRGRAQDDAHRREVAAEALKLAQHRLLTTSMEYELEAVQHAMRAIQDTIKLKQDVETPVLQQTYTVLSAMQEQARMLEVEIFERKENG